MERTIKANKDNDRKFLTGINDETEENFQQAVEMITKFDESKIDIKSEKLEYFTE